MQLGGYWKMISNPQSSSFICEPLDNSYSLQYISRAKEKFVLFVRFSQFVEFVIKKLLSVSSVC